MLNRSIGACKGQMYQTISGQVESPRQILEEKLQSILHKRKIMAAHSVEIIDGAQDLDHDVGGKSKKYLKFRNTFVGVESKYFNFANLNSENMDFDQENQEIEIQGSNSKDAHQINRERKNHTMLVPSFKFTNQQIENRGSKKSDHHSKSTNSKLQKSQKRQIPASGATIRENGIDEETYQKSHVQTDKDDI